MNSGQELIGVQNYFPVSLASDQGQLFPNEVFIPWTKFALEINLYDHQFSGIIIGKPFNLLCLNLFLTNIPYKHQTRRKS